MTGKPLLYLVRQDPWSTDSLRDDIFQGVSQKIAYRETIRVASTVSRQG